MLSVTSLNELLRFLWFLWGCVILLNVVVVRTIRGVFSIFDVLCFFFAGRKWEKSTCDNQILELKDRFEIKLNNWGIKEKYLKVINSILGSKAKNSVTVLFSKKPGGLYCVYLAYELQFREFASLESYKKAPTTEKQCQITSSLYVQWFIYNYQIPGLLLQQKPIQKTTMTG